MKDSKRKQPFVEKMASQSDYIFSGLKTSNIPLGNLKIGRSEVKIYPPKCLDFNQIEKKIMICVCRKRRINDVLEMYMYKNISQSFYWLTYYHIIFNIYPTNTLSIF